jgi:ribosomal protein L37AE/L43A
MNTSIFIIERFPKEFLSMSLQLVLPADHRHRTACDRISLWIYSARKNVNMKKEYVLPEWAPRVKAFKIRRLYESDAQGLLDSELLGEVGWALYSRCASFVEAQQARQGQIRCPQCGEGLQSRPLSKELLTCAACGWECAGRAYLDSLKHQQLDGGPEVRALFEEYIRDFPRASEASERMLAVDRLIHGFHHFLGSGRTRRPVGVNLIDGHLDFVVDFLDHLTYGPGSTPGLFQTYAGWRDKIYKTEKSRDIKKDADGRLPSASGGAPLIH